MTTNQKLMAAHEFRMYSKEVAAIVLIVMIIFEMHPEWKTAIKKQANKVGNKFKEVFSKKEA